MPVHALHHAEEKTTTEQERTTVTEEREGEASDRRDADGHPHIDKKVNEKDHGDAYAQEGAKTIPGEAGDADVVPQEEDKQQHDGDSAHKTTFFCHDGEDKIVVRDRAG